MSTGRPPSFTTHSTPKSRMYLLTALFSLEFMEEIENSWDLIHKTHASNASQ